MSTESQRKKSVRIMKWGGDDIYSWSMFLNGREVYSGMSKSEASWRRNRYIESGEL